MIAAMTIGSTLMTFSVLIVAFFGQRSFGRIPSGERMARNERSPNAREGKFRNREVTKLYGDDGIPVGDLYDYLVHRSERNLPTDSIPGLHTDLNDLPAERDALVWLGHSSVFFVAGGTRFLVDPVLSGSASPFPGMTRAFPGSDRYRPEDLPDIDVLLITHDHWDHLDYTTLVALKDRVGTVVCGLGVGETLEAWGYPKERIHELDWDDSATLATGVTVTAHTARHSSGRGLRTNRTLWCSYSIQAGGRKIFVSGDGGYGAHFATIGKAHGPYDLAILENGQYNLNLRNVPIHTFPDELALEARDLRARRVLTVHHSKFALDRHAWDEPLVLAVENFRKAGIPLLTPKIGDLVDLEDTTQVFSHWWEGVR